MQSFRLEDHTILDILRPESVVFDFGGNQGNFARGMIERFGCRVFSAEPVPALQAAFPTHPRLTLFPVAVAGRSGRMRLNVFPDRCASLEAAKPDDRAVEGVDVEAITFSQFRERAGVDRVDLIKFDIEGAELDVIESMSDAELLCAGQITIEFHAFLFPETAPRIERVIARIRQAGFHVIRYSRTTGDVLFVNRRLGLPVTDLFVQRTFVKYGRGISRILNRRAGRA